MRTTHKFYRLLTFVVLAFAVLSPLTQIQSARAAPAAVLHLTNGDYLAGQWQDSEDPAMVLWQAPFVRGVYEFPWSTVALATLPASEKQAEVAGEYCFELGGGDVLFGNLTAMSEEWYTIDTLQTGQHSLGKLQVRRQSVHRIARWNDGADLIYLGPNDLKDWKTAGGGSWQQASGYLATSSHSASIYRDLDLLEPACIEVEIAWEKRADFSLALGVADSKKSIASAFTLQVLDKSLVVMRELKQMADLELLREVSQGAGRLHYLLYLDQKQGRLIVATPAGEQLADLIVAGTDISTVFGGLRLLNREGDVRLERLHVSRWDGELPKKADGGRTTVLLKDGKTIQGDLVAYDAETKEFRIAQDASKTKSGEQEKVEEAIEDSSQEDAPPGEREPESAKPDPAKHGSEESELELIKIAADEVASITSAQALPPTSGQMLVILHNGVRLHGDLLQVQGQRLHLTCASLAKPLSLPLSTVRTVMALHSSTSSDSSSKLAGRVGKLEVAGSQMKGVLNAGETDDLATCLVWQPRSSLNALPLLHNTSGRLVYREVPKQTITPKPRRAVRAKKKPLLHNLFNALTGNTNSEKQSASLSSRHAIYLRTGDKLPCEVLSIDEQGIHLESSFSTVTQIAHEHVKAIELRTKGVDGRVTSERRDRLLTLPRMQRDNPPTHLLVSAYGDYLRCRLLGLDKQLATLEVRLEEQQVERRRVARIIWLDAPRAQQENEVESPAEPLAASERLRVQAVRSDGTRLTFCPETFGEWHLSGVSDVLAECRVDLRKIDMLLLGDRIEQVAAELAYQRWKMHHAVEPREAVDGEENAAVNSALVDQPAPDVELPWVVDGKLKVGKDFKISDYQGQVLVLDFWASWCGPCMQAMPIIDQLGEEFADRNVEIVAVNLQETPGQIAAALERLEIEPKVALDRDGVAAQRYQVTGIPQTVVIDRTGKVARLFNGGGPKFEQQLRAVLEELSAPK